MGRFIDMTGWVMSEHGVSDSRLTVVERAEDGILPSGKHITRWKCKCECGNETIVSRDQLVRKNGTKSCGCIHDEKSGERLRQMFTKNYRRYDEDSSVIEKFCPECQKWHPIENFSKRKANLDGYEWMCNDCKRHSLKSRYSAYKGGAKHRGLEFYLSIEEFDKITKTPCI